MASLPETVDELVASFKSDQLLPLNDDEFIASWINSWPDPSNIEETTKHIILNLSYARNQLLDEIKNLPMYLLEAVAFFVFMWHRGDMSSYCMRPEGLVAIPAYPACSCRECLHVYHRRWAEAEENHWNIMNRFIGALNYFYDGTKLYLRSSDGRRHNIDLDTVPIFRGQARFYATKHKMVLTSVDGKPREKVERVLIIVQQNRRRTDFERDTVRTDDDQIKESDQNKVITCGPRNTKPYPSSYLYIWGDDVVELAPFLMPHVHVEDVHFTDCIMGVAKWAFIHVLLPLSVISLFSKS